MKSKLLLLSHIPLLSLVNTTFKNTNYINSGLIDFASDEENVLIKIDYHISENSDDLYSLVNLKVNNVDLIGHSYHNESHIIYDNYFNKDLLINGINTLSLNIYANNKVFINKTLNFNYYQDEILINDLTKITKGNIIRIYYSNFDWNVESDEIYFTNCTKDNIVNEIYYRINLDELGVYIKANNKELLYKGMINLYAEEGTFKRLKYDDINKCYSLPIYLEQDLNNIDKYNFTFKNLYYDPLTLMMSSTSGDYFKKTTNFYLPLSEYDNLKYLDFSITMKDITNSKFNFNISSSLQSKLKYIGDCVNSAYCIETEEF